MEQKQTAIEWLVKTINYQIDYIPIKHWDSIRDIIQEAKEMEKEQIVDAYEIGFADAWDDARYDDEPKYSDSEQYYNETYKSE
jgi:hypothetical protein